MTDAPGAFPGFPGKIVFGDPRIDGGWRPWERRVLAFLGALRSSLESDSAEAFAEALRAPEHLSALARLHRRATSCAALEARLAKLQEDLRQADVDEASQDEKSRLVKQITAILDKLETCGE